LADVESIIKAFLSDLAVGPLEISLTNKELEDFMRAEMESKNLACEQLERTLHLAACLIEVWTVLICVVTELRDWSKGKIAYHDHSFAVKKNIALYNWYVIYWIDDASVSWWLVDRYHIYVDDMAPKDPTNFIGFEERFLSGQPQLDPVLDALVEVLMRMWDFYDPFCANSIIVSSFEFFSSTCLEPDLERLPVVQGTERFSWYLRERTGVAVAFSLMTFTKSSRINTMAFVQAVPDMTFWICVSNDLFSWVIVSSPITVYIVIWTWRYARFHKEELAGETANYVHTRAQIENKTALQVLADMRDDLRVSRDTINRVLSPSPDALRKWQVFERGYVWVTPNSAYYEVANASLTDCVQRSGWHLAQDRYKLKDLDIWVVTPTDHLDFFSLL
jgi:Trichodiene synthase (TRI5)